MIRNILIGVCNGLVPAREPQIQFCFTFPEMMHNLHCHFLSAFMRWAIISECVEKT